MASGEEGPGSPTGPARRPPDASGGLEIDDLGPLQQWPPSMPSSLPPSRRGSRQPSKWAVEISPPPRPWGSLADLSFGVLASTVQWLMSAVQAMHATADKFSEDVTLSEARREAELAHLTERIGRLEAQAQRDQSSIADLQAAAKASIARSNAKARKKASPEASDEESAEPEPPKPKVTVAAPDRDLVPAADTQSQLIDVLSMREWVLQQGYAKEVDLEVIHERMEKLQVSMEKLQDSGNSTDDRLAAVLQDVNGRAKLGDLRELKEDILRTVTDRMNFSGDELRRLRESMELKHQSLEEELEALRPRVGTLAQQLEKDRIPEGAGRLGGVEEQLRAQAELMAQLEDMGQRNARGLGPVTVGSLGNVKLEEEVRRLRSTLEVMQGHIQKVMEDQGIASDEFRQNMEFFKRSAESTGGTGESAAPPVSLGSRRSQVDAAPLPQAPLQQAQAPAPAAQVVQQVVAQPVVAQPVVAQATVVPQQQVVVQQVVVAQAVPQPQPQPPPQQSWSSRAREPPRIPEELLEMSEWWEDGRLQAASLEERMEAFVQMQAKMFKAVRHHERQVDILGSKVDDVWGQVPKVVALLEPLQAQALQDQPAAGAEDARSQIQTLRSALAKVLQNTLEDLRADLDQSVAALRLELGGALGAKAGAKDLAALSSRLDAWAQQISAGTREASPDPPEPIAGRRKPRGVMTASPDVSGERFHRHDACMVPTCPRSVATSKSTGRLPELKSPAGARRAP